MSELRLDKIDGDEEESLASERGETSLREWDRIRAAGLWAIAAETLRQYSTTLPLFAIVVRAWDRRSHCKLALPGEARIEEDRDETVVGDPRPPDAHSLTPSSSGGWSYWRACSACAAAF